MGVKKVIVIGAGAGGLSAALLLAHQGFDVTVLERRAVPGGKIRQIKVDGRGIDSGPTVFTMRHHFDALFDRVGESLDTHLTLTKADRLARHAWDGEARLDLYADPERSADAIGAFAGAREAAGFRRFMKQAATIFRLLDERFMQAPKPDFLHVLFGVPLPVLLTSSPGQSYWRTLRHYFRDPRLRQLYARYATYNGSNPYTAPNTLMLIAHAEQQGVWKVDGGMIRLAETLAKLAASRGAAFRYQEGAARIETRNGRVCGVITDKGARLPADAVICNADISAVGRGLFGEAAARPVRPVPVAKRSLSAMTWSLVGRPKGFELDYHTVFFGGAYKAEFDAIFSGGRLPDDPTTYVCAPDRSGAAPQGPERLFCLINAPAVGDTQAFGDTVRATWTEKMRARLKRCGLEIEVSEDSMAITTPQEFAEMFPGSGGALYGRASRGITASFLRPGVETRLPGLYLAGGSAHPSAGVPMAALSGRMAAECLMRR